MKANIEDSVQDLITALGIDKMDEAFQKEMIPRIIAMLDSRVGLRLSESLTEEQLEKLEEVRKTGDDDKAMEELHKMLPNYDGIVVEEVQGLKEELHDLLKDL